MEAGEWGLTADAHRWTRILGASEESRLRREEEHGEPVGSPDRRISHDICH